MGEREQQTASTTPGAGAAPAAETADNTANKAAAETAVDAAREADDSRPAFHGVRYQVRDVGRSVAFYVDTLGFKLEMQQLPAFANVSLGSLKLLLSGPAASGSRPMPDGRQQEPGGWNRIVLRVADLAAHIQTLKQAGVPLRNTLEVGPGGRQIQLEDPDGNAIELFEPARKSS